MKLKNYTEKYLTQFNKILSPLNYEAISTDACYEEGHEEECSVSYIKQVGTQLMEVHIFDLPDPKYYVIVYFDTDYKRLPFEGSTKNLQEKVRLIENAIKYEQQERQG